MKKTLSILSLVIAGSTASHAATISTGNAKPNTNVIDGFEYTDTGQFAVNSGFATGSGQTWVSSQTIKIDAISLAFKAFHFDSNPDSWTATIYTGWTGTAVTTGTELWSDTVVPTGSNADGEYVTFDFDAAEETAIGTLTAGTEYALVLNGGRPDSGAFPFILRTTTEQYANGSGIWANTQTGVTEDAYFSVQGTAVPEPSSAALLGLGGIALIMRRRK